MERIIALLLLVATTLSACASTKGRPLEARNPSTPPPGQEVLLRMALLGDAGNHKKGDFLKSGLAVASADSTITMAVLFLGDNTYPTGYPIGEEGTRDRSTLSDLVTANLEALRDAVPKGADQLWVLGNHDYYPHGAQSGREVRAQIARQGATVLPTTSDTVVGQSISIPKLDLRIVPVDLQLLLGGFGSHTECDDLAVKSYAQSLRKAVETGPAGDVVLIMSHHPLVSRGPHGNPSGWIPIHNPQDLDAPCYSRMAEAMKEVLDSAHVAHVLHVAGHDHSLQVLESDSGRWHQLVSGAAVKQTRVDERAGDKFADSHPGFLWLDVLGKGDTLHSIWVGALVFGPDDRWQTQFYESLYSYEPE